MKIGNYIKEKRLQKGMTQEELAGKCDITVRTIQRIENGEVDPRSYTLQVIASALEIDFQELVSVDASPATEDRASNGSFWLAILHLSGILLFVFPPLIIWSLNKDKIPDIRSHAIASINFQLTILLYVIVAALLSIVLIGIPILIFLGFYLTVIIIINTAKALNNEPYKYPLSIKFIK
jgi:transcriptional regulator with XRE-family HTH domain